MGDGRRGLPWHPSSRGWPAVRSLDSGFCPEALTSMSADHVLLFCLIEGTTRGLQVTSIESTRIRVHVMIDSGFCGGAITPYTVNFIKLINKLAVFTGALHF